MTKAEPQMMSRRSQGSSGAVSSGDFRVRRVMNATTGSTTSSRYFSTTAGGVVLEPGAADGAGQG